jgi:LPXTG-motif cell wall-anchored protein
MSAGLTLDPDSIEVTGYGEGTAAVVNGQTFTVTLPVNTGDKDSTTITFKATINSSALTETGKKNEVTLDYGNYHQYDSVPYEIYKTGIFKYDGATNAALKGAKFSLTAGGTALTFTKKADTETTYVVDPNGTDVLTSGEDGTIYIEGIDYDKELVLTETEAPANYNLLTDSVSIAANPYVVKMTDSLVLAGLFKVANNVGSILPSTGGIGTTIFYIVGAVLIIAGVAYFIVRRKANAQ